jgi:hypothetical protein
MQFKVVDIPGIGK